MTKEQKTFVRLCTARCAYKNAKKDYDIIEEALQRLEQYDKIVEEFKDLSFEQRLEFFKHDIILMPILEECQENRKILKIIKEKRVNVNQLLLCWKVEMYNSRCRKGYELSKEEFESIERYINNDKAN